MNVISIVKDVVAAANRDNVWLLAGSIAYFTLLSVFPLILGLLSIAGVIFADPATRERFVQSVASIFPGAEELIQTTVNQVVEGRGPAGFVATLGLIWSASGVFSAITTSLDTIWQVPHRRNLVRSALLAVGLVFGVGLVFVASLLLSAALTVAAELRLPLLDHTLSDVPFLFPLLSLALPLVIGFVVFALLYKYVPNREVGWSAVWPGALFTSVFFEVGRELFVWYLTSFAHLNAVYGSIGTVIALVTWAYFAALVLLLGAELNAVLARRSASPVTLPTRQPGSVGSAHKMD